MTRFADTGPVPAEPAAGCPCVFCRAPAAGYRWFPAVKLWPGRWEPVCDHHLHRQGVPDCYRAPDADREGDTP